jgi:polyisoprenoid-binding protein YceI
MADTPGASAMVGYVGTWKLDAAATTVESKTTAMWFFPVKVGFKVLEGNWVTEADGATTGSLVIDASSVRTGVSRRDAHLKTADFFEVDKYPTFVYTASGAAPAADGKIAVTGTMTIHGQTRPLDVLATVVESGGQATVTGIAELDRSQWGLTWAKMGTSLHNHLVVKAVFRKV